MEIHYIIHEYHCNASEKEHIHFLFKFLIYISIVRGFGIVLIRR